LRYFASCTDVEMFRNVVRYCCYREFSLYGNRVYSSLYVVNVPYKLKSKGCTFTMICTGYFVSCDTVCLKKSLVTYTIHWTFVQIICFEKQLSSADCMIVGVRGFKTRARTILCPLGWEHILWCAERLLLNPHYLLLCQSDVSHSLVFRLLTVTRALLSTLTTTSCQMLWFAGCWRWPEAFYLPLLQPAVRCCGLQVVDGDQSLII
jgi:hypothetical protein